MEIARPFNPTTSIAGQYAPAKLWGVGPLSEIDFRISLVARDAFLLSLLSENPQIFGAPANYPPTGAHQSAERVRLLAEEDADENEHADEERGQHDQTHPELRLTSDHEVVEHLGRRLQLSLFYAPLCIS